MTDTFEQNDSTVSNSLVPMVEWIAQSIVLEGWFIKTMSEKIIPSIRRLRAGETTLTEEFGPVDQLDHIFVASRSYPLPEHLHWMGDSK
jgi:hypothetical protein